MLCLGSSSETSPLWNDEKGIDWVRVLQKQVRILLS